MIGSQRGSSCARSSRSPLRYRQMPSAFSCTSQPMLFRSGSSPAVVSTIHTG